MGANRDIRCTITNRTSVTFTRHNSQLCHGDWMDDLDPFFNFNSIGPNETKSFGVKSATLSVGTGASGWLTLVNKKSSVLGWDEYLYFEINNPYISDRSTRHFVGKTDVADPSPEDAHQSSEFDPPGKSVTFQIARPFASQIPSNLWEQVSDLPGLVAYTITLPVTGFLDLGMPGAVVIDVEILQFDSQGNSPVTVWEQPFTKGQPLDLKLGDFKLTVLNKQISSLKIAAFHKITFFDASGNSVEFSNAGNSNTLLIDYVGDEWNDRIVGGTVQWVAPFGDAYAQINEEGLSGVILYEEPNFIVKSSPGLPIFTKPRHQTLGIGLYNLPHNESAGTEMHLGVRPDSISSVKVGDGYYIVLFDDLNQTGNQLTLTQNTAAIAPEWNDRAKSVKIGLGNPYLR